MNIFLSSSSSSSSPSSFPFSSTLSLFLLSLGPQKPSKPVLLLRYLFLSRQRGPAFSAVGVRERERERNEKERKTEKQEEEKKKDSDYKPGMIDIPILGVRSVVVVCTI